MIAVYIPRELLPSPPRVGLFPATNVLRSPSRTLVKLSSCVPPQEQLVSPQSRQDCNYRIEISSGIGEITKSLRKVRGEIPPRNGRKLLDLPLLNERKFVLITLHCVICLGAGRV